MKNFDFDFDFWRDLARTDPLEFERQKKDALMQVVSCASPAQQVGLSKLVDAVCAPLEGSGMDKAIAAQKLMLSSLLDLQARNIDLLNAQAGQAQISQDAAISFSKLVISHNS